MKNNDRVDVSVLAGRTIVKAWREPDTSGGSWTDCGGHLYLELDDGRTVAAIGWGHDAWGCDVTISEPA